MCVSETEREKKRKKLCGPILLLLPVTPRAKVMFLPFSLLLRMIGGVEEQGENWELNLTLPSFQEEKQELKRVLCLSLSLSL